MPNCTVGMRSRDNLLKLGDKVPVEDRQSQTTTEDLRLHQETLRASVHRLPQHWRDACDIQTKSARHEGLENANEQASVADSRSRARRDCYILLEALKCEDKRLDSVCALLCMAWKSGRHQPPNSGRGSR
ncbi:uncharacterized protein BDCG_06935 [Blastomyces dermatitidis ER-3]|uniref:Uncharacterized protein n=2 Tax=Ajellomyces dermatitidis TaxID=5039 RepID=F2TD10_AJEDA|nr:uncharacterized protein BDCG_06935 [Blastomyces dermatitidis ER-3]EEQ91815.1 hypothetical protein BDCG_06935 [Blastomyces dermatitidis ER-3]EGE81121.1 hypothetical protein BDDG_04062 [Blastomyces dermatitidis ATCC 18188]EQL34853.1 hypothetical protein BDFG_03298 [Blastomyces dermatitidis ATCC 26199]